MKKVLDVFLFFLFVVKRMEEKKIRKTIIAIKSFELLDTSKNIFNLSNNDNFVISSTPLLIFIHL